MSAVHLAGEAKSKDRGVACLTITEVSTLHGLHLRTNSKSSIKIIKNEVGNMVFVFSLLVCTAWGLIAFV